MNQLEAKIAEKIKNFKEKGCDCAPDVCEGGRADGCLFYLTREIIGLVKEDLKENSVTIKNFEFKNTPPEIEEVFFEHLDELFA